MISAAGRLVLVVMGMVVVTTTGDKEPFAAFLFNARAGAHRARWAGHRLGDV
jgi:hypothetical protein